jgi:hypothetical protein
MVSATGISVLPTKYSMFSFKVVLYEAEQDAIAGGTLLASLYLLQRGAKIEGNEVHIDLTVKMIGLAHAYVSKESEWIHFCPDVTFQEFAPFTLRQLLTKSVAVQESLAVSPYPGGFRLETPLAAAVLGDLRETFMNLIETVALCREENDNLQVHYARSWLLLGWKDLRANAGDAAEMSWNETEQQENEVTSAEEG